MRVLRCTCCGLPIAHIDDGVLVIESRHHGARHRSAIVWPQEALDKPACTAYTEDDQSTIVRLVHQIEE